MTPFNLILAATDFSAPANNAVWRAAQLARQHGARLRIVHVVSPAAFVRVSNSPLRSRRTRIILGARSMSGLSLPKQTTRRRTSA